METDALGFAISAILSQAHPKSGDWHQEVFWSGKKTPAEHNYSIRESEMLAIVEACKESWHYDEGTTHQVVVIIYQETFNDFWPTKHLIGKKLDGGNVYQALIFQFSIG